MKTYIDKIKAEEGDKEFPYKCPADKWTIGAGINLEAQEIPHDAVRLWSSLGCCEGTFEGVRLGLGIFKKGLPQPVRDLWLELIIDGLISQVSDRLHDKYDLSFGDQPEAVRIVLIDMAYQMGVSGLFKFKLMLNCLLDAHADADYWDHMAKHLLDSNYARQTPNRAVRNAELLRGLAL